MDIKKKIPRGAEKARLKKERHRRMSKCAKLTNIFFKKTNDHT